MWRYRELLPLPLDADPISLGETETPLMRAPHVSAALGLRNLWIKDESRLPGASFKARGLAMAVSMIHHFGVRRATIPSAGNAAGSAAQYCARAGISLDVFVPEDTPLANVLECRLHGAEVHLVKGLISDCGQKARELERQSGAFNLATLAHPYRIEGKKTMGLELAEQLGNHQGIRPAMLPDVIVYPTGGGTGLIGMNKAFEEWHAADPESAPCTATGAACPRFVVAQSAGCAPLVRAFETQKRTAEPFPNAATVASGLRVPSTIGDALILHAIRTSNGLAIAAEDDRILDWMLLAGRDGISLCPESAIALAVLAKAVASQHIGPDDSVVVFNTASALKYQEILEHLAN
jgi:threonine synthase